MPVAIKLVGFELKDVQEKPNAAHGPPPGEEGGEDGEKCEDDSHARGGKLNLERAELLRVLQEISNAGVYGVNVVEVTVVPGALQFHESTVLDF